MRSKSCRTTSIYMLSVTDFNPKGTISEVRVHTAIQWVSLLRFFSRRVATINRVERRSERLRASSRHASTSTSSRCTCFASLRCLRQCCCFLRCSGRCWENRAKVLFSTDHGPSWRLLLSRRGTQLALSAWIWRAAQALRGKIKRRWK